MKKLNIVVFLCILLVFGILNVFGEKSQIISVYENRTLSEKPVKDFNLIFSGDYAMQYDAYYSDHFIFRNYFIALSKNLDVLKGFDVADDVALITTEGINVGQKIQEVPKQDTGSSEDNSQTSDSNNFQNTEFGQLLILDGIAYELNRQNDEGAKAYADALNVFSEKTDAKVYSILVPTQIEFLNEDKYREMSYSQFLSIESVNQGLHENVTPIDVYEILKEHSDEYIYMRTDHHWTAFGAYYAYSAFAKAMGFEAHDLSEYSVTEYEGYLGSLYRVSQSEKLTKKPDTLYVFEPLEEVSYHKYFGGWNDASLISLEHLSEPTNQYGVYLGGDTALSWIQGSGEVDRNILMIKDSYANAFLPFLSDHYKNIYIIDPRMYEDNVLEFIKDHEIDDVIFFNYALINRYNGYSDLLLKMME
ncbi:MAG: hypothetical protein JXR88_10480 [Clostridia bacterium]|nr:hypothetical protein [Clostridia bacterium]